MALLAAGKETGGPSIGPEAVSRLAELGITHVVMLQDGTGFGVVLEGWAFGDAQAEEAAAIVFPEVGSVRVLREAASMAVSSTARTGGPG